MFDCTRPVWLVAASVLSAGIAQAQCNTILDYSPTSAFVVLNTNFTQITPANAPPFNVSGGVFRFRNVHIRNGVTVQGTGSNPMVWIVCGDFIVDGKLTVDGGPGARVNTLNSANFPAAGGIGNCGGGNGGRGSPQTVQQSPHGEPGFGPGQIPGFGGGGGLLSFNQACNRGSGGGGGSFAKRGDPYFKVKAIGTSFVQQLGLGGLGCLGQSGSQQRTLPGGAAGLSVFRDDRADNDFFGLAFNVQRQLFIRGELPALFGGPGGGGGGDRAQQLGNVNWISNNKGGGGGAGGGVLMIIAQGKIVVGPNGRISANGGHGGGGEQAGGNNQGGGGGGGAGGMLVLSSKQAIELSQHGETYANNDYSFSLSADGGIGTQGRFGGVEFLQKYPPPTQGSLWDRNPSGAFGGLGVVQLVSPTGTNQDGTNTILDDNIHLLDAAGVRVLGAEKQRYLAWRGFPNRAGVLVDDNNLPTNIGDNAGDIRPTPILMPWMR